MASCRWCHVVMDYAALCLAGEFNLTSDYAAETVVSGSSEFNTERKLIDCDSKRTMYSDV